jgi:hypothetical protein
LEANTLYTLKIIAYRFGMTANEPACYQATVLNEIACYASSDDKCARTG